jgi:methanogenic corrinoid protein MtbC1
VNKEEISSRVRIAIADFDKQALENLILEAIGSGVSPLEIAHEVIFPQMLEACRSHNAFDISFSELLLTADTIKVAFDLLIPRIKASTSKEDAKGTVVIGTVEGDIHDFGKELVAAVFQSGGYHVVDLGRDVPIEEFLEAAEKEKADIIAASTLMTPTLPNMKRLIAEVKKSNLRVKTIIGGLATSKDFAHRIGADAWAEDALAGLQELDNLNKNKESNHPHKKNSR